MKTSGKGYIIFTLTILALLLLVNGCVTEEATLSRPNKIHADSIVNVQYNLMIKEIDSLCQLVYQENFDRAVDSVSKVRLKEIENYIPSK